ncbi:MAG TPA: heterodisulfide reductase subunit C [Dehalococcoidia bacterium]|nr:heterodisulfide reductase subunit C [Dehalococcoidia bacterium]
MDAATVGLRPLILARDRDKETELVSYLQEAIGEKARACYQCGKCTAGCPVAEEMDLHPRQVLRAIQLGLKDELLRSTTIWLCLQCQVCSARCPREIDIAAIMEGLRLLAFATERGLGAPNVSLFHRIFLGLVRRFGRMYEFGLGIWYNLRARHPLANINLVPAMLARGKIAFLPPRNKGASEVRRLFARVRAAQKRATAARGGG